MLERMPATATTTTTTTDSAIETLLRSGGRRQVLSMADAVRKVRKLVPGCELRDDELGDLIARHAMVNGVSAVAFDLHAKRRPIELAVR